MGRITVSIEEQVNRILRSLENNRFREDAARAIRKGQLKGYISPGGDVHVITDGISGKTYCADGGVIYYW